MVEKFNLPKRTDDEIRMIYCGNLIDEANILEIINEFEQIHKNRPKVVLKIIYNNIIGDSNFITKINEYIKNGLKGITFKSNLNYRDECYEIATSDIGICWRKNLYSVNKKLGTIEKKYELYNLKLLTNDFNIEINTNILYFKDSFIKIILDYNKKILIGGNNIILYLSNTSLPHVSGYTIRTNCILNVINKYHKIICFVKPNKIIKYSNIYYIDNIIYYHYHDISNYQNFITNYINKNKSIKFIWSASDNFNGLISGIVGKTCNIKSIYEVRGLWHYTRKYSEQIENKFDSNFFKNYDNKEKLACSSNQFVLCENKIILNLCNTRYNINKDKLALLSNGVDIIQKKKQYVSKNIITFGYIGSIVSYEGLDNLIKKFKEIDYNNYNTELLIIGGGSTNDAIKNIKNISNLIKDTQNIKYLGSVPHNEIGKYYDKIDVICLPRKDCDVCNIVAPLKPFEAMINGKIVLASSVDAITEIINHNYNGIIFDKKNINDLKNKMIDILNNKYNLNKIIQNGYEYCDNHTWEKTCRNALNIIKSNI